MRRIPLRVQFRRAPNPRQSPHLGRVLERIGGSEMNLITGIRGAEVGGEELW